MSNRFGSNTMQVERFIERLYHLKSAEWQQVREAVSRADRAYAAAVASLQHLVTNGQHPTPVADVGAVTAGARPEQQNIHKAAAVTRMTCTRPVRLAQNDPAVSAAVNAAGGLAAREWLAQPKDLLILYRPFADVIPLSSIE